MELKATSLLLLMCVAIILTSNEAGVFPRCCSIVFRRIPRDILKAVTTYEIQSGYCETDALILYFRHRKGLICVHPRLEKVLKKLKKKRKHGDINKRGMNMTATIIILYVAKMNKTIHFQDFDKSIPGKIFPLPLLYVGNHVTGLGGTKKLRKTFPPSLVFSVLAIVLGALVAASSDLSFNAEGYTFVLLNDVFTAASGVYTKKKLGTEGLGKYGVLFYNAFIIIIPTLLASAYTGDLQKNVAVMYIGMFVGGDYIFSWPNFIGLNICISAGLIYSYITFSSSSSEANVKPAEDKLTVHVTEEKT
ncbi:UDP-N-acetylglucosamine/UDP-glucose/GDP-mannose transporter [Anabarilius grahami]|uniref:UDP-N-acetylglucosamine/UDP-glucose/GDP-mannose transporter n=1 Tax=Anabarilius grahami TaxID=495550 RepID=A0A3N0Z5I7_ANAGA|nr:UDP-N-acetylglucosamine/UDP-glucose/GDP-mannose transporter [Anabarilius grahami]